MVTVFRSLRDTRKAKKIVGPPSRRPWPARRRRYEIFEAGHGFSRADGNTFSIEQVARLAYGYFTRLADSNRYGHHN
jgi:hypothetical protein